jgi:hypothetical protein
MKWGSYDRQEGIMAIDIWERQRDLLNLKLLSARKDLDELLAIADSPHCAADKELRDRTATLLYSVRLRIDQYEKELSHDRLSGDGMGRQ